MLKRLYLPMKLQFFSADDGGSGATGGASDQNSGGNQAGCDTNNQNIGGGDNGNQGAGTTESQDSGDKNTKVFDEAYVKKLRDEAASYRTKLRDIEIKSQEERQNLIQQLFGALGIEADPNKEFEKQLQEARAKAQEVEQRANERLIRAEVKAVATELGLVDAEAALALMDRSGVKIVDDGSVEGVKEALEALVSVKPWLKKQAENASIGGGTNPPNHQQIQQQPKTLNEAIGAYYASKRR
jgi:ethanolamine utilization microcompartment shell protein EutS